MCVDTIPRTRRTKKESYPKTSPKILTRNASQTTEAPHTPTHAIRPNPQTPATTRLETISKEVFAVSETALKTFVYSIARAIFV